MRGITPEETIPYLEDNYRLEWDALEQTYRQVDVPADALVAGLLAWARKEKAHCAGTLRALDQWETRHQHYDTLRDAVLPRGRKSIGELWHIAIATLIGLLPKPAKRKATASVCALTAA